jgi:hypothetical protein
MKITAARITALPKSFMDPLPVVYVTAGGEEQRLFDYFPDEISFRAEEFVGLTLDEARGLKFTKDKRFLQS